MENHCSAEETAHTAESIAADGVRDCRGKSGTFVMGGSDRQKYIPRNGENMLQNRKHTNDKLTEQTSEQHQMTQMQKESIIQKLKERGCRITKQRKMILDIILQDDCSCCKEIYYKASKKDPRIGSATVYRMINTLEEIGAINRKNMYKISCDEQCQSSGECMIHMNQGHPDCNCAIELEDDTVIELSPQRWSQILQTGLKACGYNIDGQQIRCVKRAN